VADITIQDLQTADPLRSTLVGIVTLDGVRLGLRLWQNSRSFRWAIDILDVTGQPLIEGHALASNADVFRPYRSRHPQLPGGQLFALDVTGSGASPTGFQAWRETHRLVYRPAADL
jgi:hypothetical protein